MQVNNNHTSILKIDNALQLARQSERNYSLAKLAGIFSHATFFPAFLGVASSVGLAVGLFTTIGTLPLICLIAISGLACVSVGLVAISYFSGVASYYLMAKTLHNINESSKAYRESLKGSHLLQGEEKEIYENQKLHWEAWNREGPKGRFCLNFFCIASSICRRG